MNQAEITHLVSKLRINNLAVPRKFRNNKSPEAKINKLRDIVTALLKYERLELAYSRADEARGYAERLISEAIRHGDVHPPTMELASFWLNEKQLVHKLFKVLVPRFRDYQISYTALYRAPKKYPDNVIPHSVLELRGNPFPPLIFDGSRNKLAIHNVLLDEARREYRKEKYAEIAAKVSSSEKQQKQNEDKIAKESETKTKAAQDVSEGEQLLKCTDNEKYDEEDRETNDKPLPIA